MERAAAPVWEELLTVQRVVEAHFPDALREDDVTHSPREDGGDGAPDLSRFFKDVLTNLERLAGWRIDNMSPPAMVLRDFEGVETGIRQLRRIEALETEAVAGVQVPTLAEMVRIKGWLIVSRNLSRDYVDFAALASRLDPEQFVRAVWTMDRLYPQDNGESPTRQLAKQLADPRPVGRTGGASLAAASADVPAPADDWEPDKATLRELALEIMTFLLEEGPDEGVAMRHRHINPGHEDNFEAVFDVLERGSLANWRELAQRVLADPFGPLSETVLMAAAGSSLYGSGILWRDWVESVRRAQS